MTTKQTNLARRGFTLIELMVVLVIIGLLVAAVAPAFNSITRSQSFRNGAHELAEFLEYARTEAVTRQTYVWVGLKTEQSGGHCEVVAAAVYSKDGTGTNADPANLALLSRAIRLPLAQLVASAELRPAVRDQFGRPTAGVIDNSAGLAFKAGAREFDRTLTFTPGGEALLKGAAGPDDGFDAAIDVGVRQTRGLAAPPNAEEAALLVNGSNGAVSILQIQ